MTEPAPNPRLFKDRKAFLAGVIEKPGTPPCDLQETFRKLTPSGKAGLGIHLLLDTRGTLADNPHASASER